MGKIVFLDLVDRSGRIQLLCPADRTGPVDVDLGDVVGAQGAPSKTRRGEPSLTVDELTLLAKIRRPLPDTFHGVTDTETRYRQRYLDLLMNEESRAETMLRARMVTAIRAYLDGAGVRRGRDADPAAALRRRLRRAVRHALEPPRPGPLPPHRRRALPQAADRRRAREGLRAGEGLPQRELLVQALARVHAGRVVRGLRRLPRHDGALRGARRAASRWRRTAGTTTTFRGHEVDLATALAARALPGRARGRAGRLDARRRRSCARSSSRPESTSDGTRPGHSSSTTPTRTSSSRS